MPQRDLPVLVHRASAHAQGLRLRGTRSRRFAPDAATDVAFPMMQEGRRPRRVFGAPWLACAFPCQRFAASFRSARA